MAHGSEDGLERGEHLLTLHGVEGTTNGGEVSVLMITTFALFFLLSVAYLYGPPTIYLLLAGGTLLCGVVTVIAYHSGANSHRDAELYSDGILIPVSRWEGGERFVPRDEVNEVEMSTGQFGHEPPNNAKGEWAMLILIIRDDDLHGTGWKRVGDVHRAMELIRSEWGIEVERTD